MIKDNETISEMLKQCRYTQWTITSVNEKMVKKEEKKKEKVHVGEKERSRGSRGMIMIPCVKGFSERIEQVMKKWRLSTAIRPHMTFRKLLVNPKDKAEPMEGVYKIKCQGCGGCYVGETKRKLAVKVKEHKADIDNTVKDGVFIWEEKQSETERNKSAIIDHVCQTHHLIDEDSARIVDRQSVIGLTVESRKPK